MKNSYLQRNPTTKIVLISLLLCVVGMTKGYAYDFSAVCETGQTLYYNIINAEYHYVELTCPSSYWSGFTKPTGDIILPRYVYDSYDNQYYVTSIDYAAFRDCNEITSISISKSITTIGTSAFDNCNGLEVIIVESGNTVLDSRGNCNAVIKTNTNELVIGCKNTIIPNTVNSVGTRAFYGCTGLTSIIIPNSVTSIGSYAFYECSGLTGSLIIPNSVTWIGNYAFCGCCGFENISVESGNTIFDSRDGCDAIIRTNTNEMILGCKNTVIPNSITRIGDYTFSGCTELASISIPNSVISIGQNAFRNCSGLTGNLVIPNSVTTLEHGAFYGCSGFTGALIIPNSVTTIYSYVFCGCNGFTSLTLPNSMTMISANTFDGCSGFLGELILPNSVTTIGNCAFRGCSGLTRLTIPNSVTTIEPNAFQGCSGFWGQLNIPNSVTTIETDAFRDCSGLVSIEIPNTITTIEGNVFKGCSGLEQIIVESGNTIYDSRNGCNAIVETNTNTLISGCNNTIIPNTITSIGSFAFSGSGLASIEIPNSVTSIGYNAFSYSNSLTSLTIANSVTSIGSSAFDHCSELSSITMFAITPPTLGYSAFEGTSYTLKIYVPYESLQAYKAATNWGNYQSRIYPWLQKSISGYGTGNGGWQFIASPLLSNVAPTEINGMIQELDYDLYRFNQSADAEWENYKNPVHTEEFFINNGKGYLYANKEDVNIMFKGIFNEFDERMVSLVYDEGKQFSGWNLVGNPFPVSAYANRSYYVMNEEGSAIEPIAVSSTTAIEPCMGIMVKADGVGESVTFTKSSRQVESNGLLQIAVAESTRSNTIEDKAVVSFNEGDALGKFVFNKNNAQISIPQSGEDYAIACVEKGGEIPLNFKAAKNGSYTLSVNPEAVEMEYLHLVDNLTGNDIDLLVTPSYTFEAKTSDYASRFRLVFSVYEDVDGDNEEPFAFISNGSIIVTGDYDSAMMQIVDLTGRVVVSTEVANNVSVNKLATGVYVLRLINGENVRTQKIVVNN